MNNSVYKINKGINKPIVFKGLKAQYIMYVAVGLVALMILFAVLYVIGVNMFICLGLIVALGTILFMTVYRMSARYGQYGLLKKMASRKIPFRIKATSRKIFLHHLCKV
jgi:hypothetical protein